MYLDFIFTRVLLEAKAFLLSSIYIYRFFLMLDSHMSHVCSLCIYDLKQPTQISQEKLAEMGAIVVVLCVFCCLYTLC